jgi:hypothetical protein
MANKGKAGSKADTGANLGFEAKLWQMADGLRNNMDAAEYIQKKVPGVFSRRIAPTKSPAKQWRTESSIAAVECLSSYSHSQRGG